MTSEIRTNSFKSRAGLSTVTLTDTGPIISGVTTANNFKSGISNLHSLGLTLTGGQLDVGSNIKLGNAGVITATSFVGSGANLTGITAGLSNIVEDTSPQLGANLDVNGANILFGDSSSAGTNLNRLKFGAGTDLHIWHNASTGNSNISNYNGDLYIQGNNGSGTGVNQIRIQSNGAVELNYQGGQKFTTTNTGVQVNGKLVFNGSGHLNGVNLGASQQLNLYHDTNDAYFDNSVGDFYIRNDGNSTSEVLRFQAKGNQNSIICTPNGGTSIYFNGSRKFFTQNLGCTVESTGNTPELTFRGASNLDMGKIDVDQFATNYSMMRFFTLTNGTETEYARMLDNGNFCVGGMIGSSNNNNIQSPGQGNGNTNIGSAVHVSGRFICNSTSSFSSFGRNSTGLVVSFTRQGGDQGGITVGVGYVSYGSGSDYRLKENVAPLTDAITRIKQLEPKRFNFIQDTTDTLRDGFLAHEVSSIVPEAITGTKDEVDSDNNPVYQQIDQAKLVPLLTASIQELITKVETLEQENIALRIRVTNLEDN